MDRAVEYHIDTIDAFVGKEIGVSDWLTMEQGRIDRFAEVTEDFNPLHVDVEQAAAGPFGSTIAHGFLTLSLLSYFSYQAGFIPAGVDVAINYGFERIRFMAPVRPGDRIRSRVALIAADDRGEGRYLLRSRNVVEIEGQPKPALVANWLSMVTK